MAQDENPQRETWIELGLNVVAPTVALLFLSDEDRLGPELGLAIGLSFPLMHVVYSRIKGASMSPLSVLALIGVLLTGGIGVLRLDARWFAVKEAVVPLVMGAFTLVSRSTPWPVVDTLVWRMLDLDKVQQALADKGHPGALQPLVDRVTWWFIGGFGYSAVVSFFLARYLVTSPAGTVAFNEELGRFTFISFPVVAVPMTIAMGFALNGMLNQLETLTGQEIDDLLRPGLAPKKS